jgi:hypothetical protein
VLNLDEDRGLKVLRRGCGVPVDQRRETPTKGVLGRKYRHLIKSFLSDPDA